MDKLIRLYFTDSLTAKGLDQLVDLLQIEENQELFKQYALDYHNLTLTFQDLDVRAEYLNLLAKHKGLPMTRTKKWPFWLKVAASFAILTSAAYYLFTPLATLDAPLDESRTNSITITLDIGEVKVIDEGGQDHIHDKAGKLVGTQQGLSINYADSLKAPLLKSGGKLVFNKLAIPYGKTFKLRLSDGTKVQLNAGTVLRYPVRFKAHKERQVFLSGEAYFEVAEDKASPFVVTTEEMNIRALGTKFNVNSYSGDTLSSAVLVEGSVAVYGNDRPYKKEASALLAPNQMASWRLSDKQLDIDAVEVAEYVAWTKGLLMFKMRPFSEIVKVLERHYDVRIINNNPALDETRFFATFDIETIDEVMASFQNSVPFSYKREGDLITLD